MRREYAGAAQAAKLTSNLGGSTSDLTIYCNNLTNWPTGTVGPFYVVIDRGTATEEKILCVSRAGNTLSVYDDGVTNGRAADDTAITAHSINADIEHVFTATDADEANLHVNSDAGVHGVTGDVVGTTDAQTLTNKTINAASLSVEGVGVSLKNKTVNTVSVDYTLAVSDVDNIVQVNTGMISAVKTVTVPAFASIAIPVGSAIKVLTYGSGTISIAAAAGVTINVPSTSTLTPVNYRVVTLTKLATNTWVIEG